MQRKETSRNDLAGGRPSHSHTEEKEKLKRILRGEVHRRTQSLHPWSSSLFLHHHPYWSSEESYIAQFVVQHSETSQPCLFLLVLWAQLEQGQLGVHL